jgi:hypothetical protein
MVRCMAPSVADAALSALSMKSDTTANGLAFSIAVFEGARGGGECRGRNEKLCYLGD